jgi:hypothetical protein
MVVHILGAVFHRTVEEVEVCCVAEMVDGRD